MMASGASVFVAFFNSVSKDVICEDLYGNRATAPQTLNLNVQSEGLSAQAFVIGSSFGFQKKALGPALLAMKETVDGHEEVEHAFGRHAKAKVSMYRMFFVFSTC